MAEGDRADTLQIDKDVDVAVRLGVDLHVMAAATAIAPETRQQAEHRLA